MPRRFSAVFGGNIRRKEVRSGQTAELCSGAEKLPPDDKGAEQRMGKAQHQKPGHHEALTHGKAQKNGKSRVAGGGGKLTLKILCIVLVGLVGLGCTGAAVLLGYGRGLLSRIRHEDGSSASAPLIFTSDMAVSQPDISVEPVDPNVIKLRGNTQNVTNIMLIGVDNRGGETYGRSDTNMILSINRANQTIKLISLMRDTWVRIPGLDYNGDGEDDYAKLNAAYSSGGYPLLRETLKKNYLLDIPQYVTVDFSAFDVGVDALGGIDMELTETEAKWIPLQNPGDPDIFARSFDGYQLLEPIGYTAGNYHLEGFQTLAYCRLRYIYADSDYSRQGNQRAVVSKLIEKAKQSSPAALLTLLREVLPYVSTNISQGEIENYVVNVFDYMGYGIENDHHVPAGGEFTNLVLSGAEGLWIDDPSMTVSSLHQYIYG